MDTADLNDLPGWGARLYDWLGLPADEISGPPRPLRPPDRFSWEPPLPPRSPPQWGAADRPEFLAGDAMD